MMVEQEDMSTGGNIKTAETSFLQEIPIEDTKSWDLSLKKEIIYWGGFDITVNKPTDSYIELEFDKVIKGENDKVLDIYYVNTGKKGEENKYIYNKQYDIVYKVKPTKIHGNNVHSIEELDYILNGGERNKSKQYTKIKYDAKWVTVNNTSYYEPDLNGFGLEVTSLVFYKLDENSAITEETYEMPVSEWIEKDRPNQITKDESNYILYDYANRVWANIKVDSDDVESWWVWIPRYAYQNVEKTTITNTIFINNENKTGEQGAGTLPKGYAVQSAFEGNSKKGLLISKYQPTNVTRNVSTEFAYYIPDLSGFDKDNTYLEVYDKDSGTFSKEVKASEVKNLSKFSQENLWFDYDNKIWANVKVVINNIETWWVWIPRYAYRNDNTSTEVIFLDENNKPLNGKDLPSTYTVQSAFEGNNKKGIWVSKYQPSPVSNKYTTNLNTKTIPDLTGFTKQDTYLEIYDKNTKTFKYEVQLSTITNLEEFCLNNLWYDYNNRIYANVKVVKNGIETWWVYIPRYAYRNDNTITDVLLIDENNKQLNGKDLPSTYTIQSAFQGNTKKGIWVSKYQPTGS